MSDNKTKDMVQVVDELRVKAEKYGAESAEFKSFQEKTEKLLNEAEEKNAKIVAEIAEERKAREEMQEQYKDLEVEMARKGTQNGVDYKETAEYKALNEFARKGLNGIDAEAKALLRSDNDTQGGFLTDVEMSNEIIRSITEISPVRQVSKVRSVSRKTLEMPVRTSIPVAYWEGEAEAGQESSATYGSETMTCTRLTHIARYTADLLLDSGFDIQSEISKDASEAYAFAEGKAFVTGNDPKQPEGFLANAGIVAGASTSESSATITGDDLLKLTGELKVGYNPLFGFNRQTLAHLRTLKGSDGQYLWQAGLAPNQPNTIGGESYVVMQDMPAYNVAGNLAVIYGDFMRGYEIIDRVGTTVKRDDLTEAAANITRLIFHRYLTGKVILPEAFKALKIKA